jgi:hypothetical protein
LLPHKIGKNPKNYNDPKYNEKNNTYANGD